MSTLVTRMKPATLDAATKRASEAWETPSKWPDRAGDGAMGCMSSPSSLVHIAKPRDSKLPVMWLGLGPTCSEGSTVRHKSRRLYIVTASYMETYYYVSRTRRYTYWKHAQEDGSIPTGKGATWPWHSILVVCAGTVDKFITIGASLWVCSFWAWGGSVLQSSVQYWFKWNALNTC